MISLGDSKATSPGTADNPPSLPILYARLIPSYHQRVVRVKLNDDLVLSIRADRPLVP